MVESLSETEELVVALVRRTELTPEQQLTLRKIMVNLATCDAATSYDQGSRTHCLLPRRHDDRHAGISRDEVVRWE